MSVPSPWRYPGGKSRLSKAILEHLPGVLEGYVEPFAGGGGFTLPALSRVPEGASVALNDADPRVAAWWEVMALGTDAQFESLVEKIEEYKPTVKSFLSIQKKSLKSGRAVDRAFSAIVTNRCAYSGILNAGPIGGLGQLSAYDVGCRYNPSRLAKQHRQVRDLLQTFDVQVGMKDFRDFLAGVDREAFWYLDPPYVKQGKNLYPTHFDIHDHEDLAELLLTKGQGWAASYDDDPWVRETYASCTIIELTTIYSVNSEIKGDRPRIIELLILP